MNEPNQPQGAGQLASRGVRSWFEFTRGSPRDPIGAQFWLRGPWGKVIGAHRRNGWSISWIAPPGVVCTLVVVTFTDMVRLAKLGPEEASRRYHLACEAASKTLGAKVSQLGDR